MLEVALLRRAVQSSLTSRGLACLRFWRAGELKRLLPLTLRRLYGAIERRANLQPQVKTDLCTPNLLVITQVIDGKTGQGDEVSEDCKVNN